MQGGLREYADNQPVAADRPPRLLEGAQGQANSVVAVLRQAVERLSVLRVRLLGDDENASESNQAPQPVRAEVQELSHTLSMAQDKLDEVMSAIERLESI